MNRRARVSQHDVMCAFCRQVPAKSQCGKVSTDGQWLWAGSTWIAVWENGEVRVRECVHPWVARKVQTLTEVLGQCQKVGV